VLRQHLTDADIATWRSAQTAWSVCLRVSLWSRPWTSQNGWTDRDAVGSETCVAPGRGISHWPVRTRTRHSRPQRILLSINHELLQWTVQVRTSLLHPFNGLFSGTTRVISRYQKCKTTLDVNEARDGGVLGCNGISWTICKQSAPLSRQITSPTPHHSIFYRPDALPDAQPTVSKHWRYM